MLGFWSPESGVIKTLSYYTMYDNWKYIIENLEIQPFTPSCFIYSIESSKHSNEMNLKLKVFLYTQEDII